MEGIEKVKHVCIGIIAANAVGIALILVTGLIGYCIQTATGLVQKDFYIKWMFADFVIVPLALGIVSTQFWKVFKPSFWQLLEYSIYNLLVMVAISVCVDRLIILWWILLSPGAVLFQITGVLIGQTLVRRREWSLRATVGEDH